jgi:hypothetical protein
MPESTEVVGIERLRGAVAASDIWNRRSAVPLSANPNDSLSD